MSHFGSQNHSKSGRSWDNGWWWVQGSTREPSSISPSVAYANFIGLGLTCLLVAATVAWLNRFHSLQSGIYKGRYLTLAHFIRGETEQPLITYPLWGYPLILSSLPFPEITSIALQLVISVIVLLVVYSTAAPYLKFRFPLAILCVIAIPWYALASVKLADIYSASFGVLAICFLARALNRKSLGWTGASGVSLGASLNFRSDFIVIFSILFILTAVLAPRLTILNLRRFLLVSALALVLLVPWGGFRMYHGKSFGVTSTNSGMVLYNSLGFPGNVWGITSSDRMRTFEVRDALGPGTDPASEAGNAFFRAQFLTAIRAEPVEFLRKVAYNFSATLKLGFYTIETWTFLSQDDRLEFDVLKEQLKYLFGARPYLVRVEDFRSRGLWDENFSIASVTPRQWALLAYPILNSGLSAAYLACLLIAIGYILLFDRTRLRQPILLFCIAGTLGVFMAVSLIQYEPRQINVLYPLGMPLIVVLIERIGGLKRHGNEEQNTTFVIGRISRL